MKIGVLFTVYNCEDYLNDCLSPWFELKDKYDIVFASNSGMFSDYLHLGIPYRNEETLKILSNYDMDFLITTKGKNLLGEDESRNLCLDYLNKRNCDLIWVLDGDEIYTKEQIENILEYIQKNPTYDYYSVNFKNLTISENYHLDYTHERITWTNRHDGIKSFYFDNQFIFNDGTLLKDSSGIEIPKSVAHILHKSWLSSDIRTKDKIIYQRHRYNGDDGQRPIHCRCTYEWNEEKNRLEFSKEFHECRGVELPCLHEPLSIFSTDLTINYSRRNTIFNISKIERPITGRFEIYNGDTNQLLCIHELSLERNINYFIAPPHEIPYDLQENFNSFLIKIYEFNKLIHNEKIHLKLK
jgi:hypothetical protein